MAEVVFHISGDLGTSHHILWQLEISLGWSFIPQNQQMLQIRAFLKRLYFFKAVLGSQQNSEEDTEISHIQSSLNTSRGLVPGSLRTPKSADAQVPQGALCNHRFHICRFNQQWIVNIVRNPRLVECADGEPTDTEGRLSSLPSHVHSLPHYLHPSSKCYIYYN